MTKRGIDFVKELHALQPNARLAVFSSREEPWEPPFLDELGEVAAGVDGIFHEARSLTNPSLVMFWQRFNPELLLLVNWRYHVDEPVLSLPRRGTFVFHDSLLPEYRGFSPTSWAIINGEDHTGVTLMKAAQEVDAGDIVDQRAVVIGPDDYIGDVTARVTATYIELLRSNLYQLLDGGWQGVKQDETKASYTCKRLPDDSLIDWSRSTRAIYDLIRGTSTPYPGAFTFNGDQRLTILRATPELAKRYTGRVPGAVVAVRPGAGSVVLTGDGALLVTEVSLPGLSPQPAAEVLNSIAIRLRAGG